MQDVLDRINPDELVKVALDLGNIDSPTGCEGEMAEFVYGWLEHHGFAPRKLGLFRNRCNVVATLPGNSHGRSLVFNSHMDTTIAKEEVWITRRAADPILHSAWREGDLLIGNGICNDKGPMAAWLIAAKAICESGVGMKGDLILTAQAGRWFAYPWWEPASEAPDYARHVDIHNKPGYDPCELFFDVLPTRVSLDATRICGSHGLLDDQPQTVYATNLDLHEEVTDLPSLARALRQTLSGTT